MAGRYGPHRDELYFLAAGRHPQLGYPDQPPLTPLVAAAADLLAPGSLFALRFLSAVLVGGTVLLTVDLVREFGGDRLAQLLAAVTIATSAGVLAVGHLLSTSTLDLSAWTVVIRLAVGVLHRDAPRGWLWVGLAAGVGLENKSLVAPLLGGLVLGIALTPGLRRHLRSPWAWAGASQRRPAAVGAEPLVAGPERLAAADIERRYPRRVRDGRRCRRADRAFSSCCSIRSVRFWPGPGCGPCWAGPSGGTPGRWPLPTWPCCSSSPLPEASRTT